LLKQFQSYFVKHDTKNIKKLDVEGMHTFLKGMGQEREFLDVEMMIRSWDLDNDGFVSFPEFAAFVSGAPSQIDPFIYLGNQWGAQNWETLRRLKVTHVINCCGDKCPCPFPQLKYLVLPLSDSDSQPIEPCLKQACDFVSEALKDPSSKIYIHCTFYINYCIE
jgi:hypothetical protein